MFVARLDCWRDFFLNARRERIFSLPPSLPSEVGLRGEEAQFVNAFSLLSFPLSLSLFMTRQSSATDCWIWGLACLLRCLLASRQQNTAGIVEHEMSRWLQSVKESKIRHFPLLPLRTPMLLWADQPRRFFSENGGGGGAMGGRAAEAEEV